MNTTLRLTVAAFGLAIFTVSTATVQAQFDYIVTNGTITITKYTGPGGAVTIPDTINGLPVRSIGPWGLTGGCNCLTSVAIAETVTNIAEGAFAGCASLNSIRTDALNPVYCSVGGILFDKSQSMLIQYPAGRVGNYVIPDRVTGIGQYAFSGCTGLTRVVMSASVSNIGNCAFVGCTNLSNITISDSVTRIGGEAFRGCTGLTNLMIGNSVIQIAAAAFADCTNLTSVTIPDSVASIGHGAFQGCTSLTDVVIGNGVTNMEHWVFSHCPGLRRITVDALNSCYSSADGVLFDKMKTTLLHCLEGKAGSYDIPDGVTNIRDNSFGNCSSLTNVTIPDSVNSIGHGTFMNCSSLTSVSIPNTVTRIGEYAFAGCGSLTSVAIPNGVTGIGIYTFSGCSSLTSVTIPDGITSIGDGAFQSCASLTGVTIPDSVAYIGNGAFSHCTSLTGVTIPDSVISIGGGSFNGCTRLTAITVDALNPFYSSRDGVLFNQSQTTLLQCPGGKTGRYTIPGGVTNIGDGAFAGCSRLTSVVVPNGLTSIPALAFADCGNLTSVAMPDSVSSIGPCAFSGCTSLASIAIPTKLTSMGDDAFSGCTNLANVTIASGATSIGSRAFSGCTSLASVTIPDSVTNIRDGPFPACTKLTAITVDALNSVYSSVDGVLFDKSQTTLLQCPGGKADHYTIPDTVTRIGYSAFSGCTSLASVAMPDGLTGIGEWAFSSCTSLTRVTIPRRVTTICGCSFWSASLVEFQFEGNAPAFAGWDCGDLFDHLGPSGVGTVYYRPGTTGWGCTYGGLPAVPWFLPNPVILESSVSVQTNGFGFTISWATNTSIVVEACTDLARPTWTLVSTNTLTDGWCYFIDAEWTNYTARFYRVRQQ